MILPATTQPTAALLPALTAARVEPRSPRPAEKSESFEQALARQEKPAPRDAASPTAQDQPAPIDPDPAAPTAAATDTGTSADTEAIVHEDASPPPVDAVAAEPIVAVQPIAAAVVEAVLSVLPVEPTTVSPAAGAWSIADAATVSTQAQTGASMPSQAAIRTVTSAQPNAAAAQTGPVDATVDTASISQAAAAAPMPQRPTTDRRQDDAARRPNAPVTPAVPQIKVESDQPAAQVVQVAGGDAVTTPAAMIVEPVAAKSSSGESVSTAQGQSEAGARSSSGEDEALNAARLSRGLQSVVNQRGGAITLRLTPPELGTVRIQMQLTASRVSVQFHAETQQGTALLSQQLGQLRSTLEGQGLQVDRIQVQTMQSASPGQGSQTSQQQSDSSSQQDTRADDGRSRGSFDRRHEQPREGRRQEDEARFDFQRLVEQSKES